MATEPEVTQSNVDLLKSKYPKLFNRHTLGVNFGDGWYKLLDELCEAIQGQCEKHDIPLKAYPFVEQIKEKFGGLRFYMSSLAHDGPGRLPKDLLDDIDEAIYNLIGEAESRSTSICENCGQPGKQRDTEAGWIKTWCEDCYKRDIGSHC